MANTVEKVKQIHEKVSDVNVKLETIEMQITNCRENIDYYSNN